MSQPNLNRVLTLEAPEQVSDGAGGFTQEWTSLGTLWAQVTAGSGRETGRYGTTVSRMVFKIVVRSAPWGNPDRPKPEQRFRDGTRIFNIQAVAEHDAQGCHLVCYAHEEVAV